MSWHTDYWFLACCLAQASQPSARSSRRRPPARRPVRQLRPSGRQPHPRRRDRTRPLRRRNRRPHPALARRLPRRPARRQRPRHRPLLQRRRPICSRRHAWPVTVRKPKMAQRCTVRKPPISARAFQRLNLRRPSLRQLKYAPACHPTPRRVDPHWRMKSTAAGGFSARCRSGRRRRSTRAAHAVH